MSVAHSCELPWGPNANPEVELPRRKQIRVSISVHKSSPMRRKEEEEEHFKLWDGLHHGPWSRTMEDDLFAWSDFMVRFLKKSIYKAFGPPSRCKLNVDHKIWPCTKKCYFFLNLCPKWVVLKGGIFFKFWSFFLSSLVFIFSFPKKNSFKFFCNNISMSWVLAFSTEASFFASPTAKLVEPC